MLNQDYVGPYFQSDDYNTTEKVVGDNSNNHTLNVEDSINNRNKGTPFPKHPIDQFYIRQVYKQRSLPHQNFADTTHLHSAKVDS